MSNFFRATFALLMLTAFSLLSFCQRSIRRWLGCDFRSRTALKGLFLPSHEEQMESGRRPKRLSCSNGWRRNLTVKFSYNIDPDEDHDSEYDALVLQRKLPEGQNCIAAACTILTAEESNVEVENEYLRLDLGGFVQVFNENRNEVFNMLPIANDVLSYTSIVCIS